MRVDRHAKPFLLSIIETFVSYRRSICIYDWFKEHLTGIEGEYLVTGKSEKELGKTYTYCMYVLVLMT